MSSTEKASPGPAFQAVFICTKPAATRTKNDNNSNYHG